MRLRKSRRTRRRTQKRRRVSQRTAKQRGGAGKIDLVIARYKEPIDWIADYKDRPFHKIYLYNKSTTPVACDPLGFSCAIEQLPNVGVIDHTILNHLYTKYDSLGDVTIFIPASANMFHKRSRADATVKKVFETNNSVIYGFIRPEGVKKHNYNFKIDRWVTSNPSNQESNEAYRQDPAPIRPFGRWYEHFFPGQDSQYESNAGIFAVSRTHVHQRPREFYKKLLDEVDSSKYHEASHFMERCWPSIFHPFPPECFYEVNFTLFLPNFFSK